LNISLGNDLKQDVREIVFERGGQSRGEERRKLQSRK